MKRLGAILRALLALATTVVWASGAHAQDCVGPGDIIDLPTPSWLLSVGFPDIVYDQGSGPRSMDLVSITSSRLRVRAPRDGLVEATNMRISNRFPDMTLRNIAVRRSCDAFDVATTTTITRPTRQVTVQATRNDVAAPSGGPEYALVGGARAVSRAEALIIQQGGTILRRKSLGAVGQAILFIDLNGQLSIDELRANLQSRGIDVEADRHSVYEGAQGGGRSYAPQLIGYPEPSQCRLRTPVRIGIVDGPIDTRHPLLSRTEIETRSVLNPEERPGSTSHATAIAALIAGTGEDVFGVANGARLFGVTAFARAGGRDVARLENIAEGIDWLVQRKVDLANLSLEGPRNRALSRVIRIAADRGLVMVAAAGNGGQARVAYPASDPQVIAVTAVDAAKRLYRRASYGAEVDFAAPGVDILVPRRRGGRSFESGTSFASAFATAMIAYEADGGRITAEGVRRALAARAEDLGERGRDDRFGFGLIKSNGC